MIVSKRNEYHDTTLAMNFTLKCLKNVCQGI